MRILLIILAAAVLGAGLLVAAAYLSARAERREHKSRRGAS
jgi:uncharacterized protein involved in exopolysaccharide biosynthesis